jgi:hypothetical protein
VTRRARGDGGLRWDEKRRRWIAEITIGYDGRGKRIVRKASGRTKTAAKNKLRDMLRDQADGLPVGSHGYTVRHAVEDWLTYGLANRDPVTQKTNRHLCDKHVLPLLGARKLRDLTAPEVDAWLTGLSATLSTRTLEGVRACLNRSVKRAMARDKVKRNVVELTEVPTGRPGRRSKSLSAEQADDVLTKTAPDRLHAYIVVSLLTGARTEELRALRWEHVQLDPDTGPPYLEVWRSVRGHGDTKTESRGARWPCPVCVQTRFVLSGCSRRKIAWPRGSGGPKPGSCSPPGWAPAWTRPTSVATFAARWPWCPAPTRPPGLHASYGTPSFHCSPTLECPLRTSRSSSATAAPLSPNWSTDTRSGPSSRPARRSWIGSSDRAARVRSHSIGHSVAPAGEKCHPDVASG